MTNNETLANVLARLDAGLPAITERDARYRGRHTLKFAADEVTGDLKHFGVNLCALAVDAVAERMRMKQFKASVRGRDVTAAVRQVWLRSNMDQKLMPVIVDALALGSAYLTVWPSPRTGHVSITPESARQVACQFDPVTGEVTAAVKRWYEYAPSGALKAERVIYYGPDVISYYVRGGNGRYAPDAARPAIPNPLGVVPVVPMINVSRVGDTAGSSVIDDLAHLVDALGKMLADMLVASEDVARPRRWATGVDLEDDDEDDGFMADAPDQGADAATVYDDPAPAVSPFDSGNRMFTVESPDAKFGQLPGADLAGYKTGVDLLTQQIMAVSALPAHMVGVTTSNPASADAIRSAEASLTARAESRINVLGLAVEKTLQLAAAMVEQVDPRDVHVRIRWGSPATKSTAQEADAVTKLFQVGILDREEARDMMGITEL